MTYSTSTPPAKIAQLLGGNGAVWLYKSTDVDSATNAASYYSNGYDLGMKAGDIVLVIDTTTPKGSLHYVTAVVTDGAATTAFGAVS